MRRASGVCIASDALRATSARSHVCCSAIMSSTLAIPIPTSLARRAQTDPRGRRRPTGRRPASRLPELSRMRQLALLLTALVLFLMSGDPSAATVTVPAGGDLQRALNAARPGDTILLEPGATYTGNFFLPAKGGDDERPITLRTAGESVPAGQRVTPEHAARLAKLRSPDNMPVLRTQPRARFWRIEL